MLTFTGFQILAMILFGTTMWHLNNTIEEHTTIEDGVEVIEHEIDQKRPIYESILYIYLLVFGEFNTDGFNDDKGERWLLFISATILLQLVMLNLLIAIMSDTFEKVMAEIEVSDGLELNNLILDAESLKRSNRDDVTKSVLHWVEYKTQNNKDWGGRSKTVTNALGATEAAMVKAITVQ